MNKTFKNSINYVPCAYRKAWVCFDLDNGHAFGKKSTGKGYMWVFPTRQKAREHRKWQNSNPNYARLSTPTKIEIPRT